MTTTHTSNWDRITFDPEVMGGKPCIRDLRVTVGTIVGLSIALPTQATSNAIFARLKTFLLMEGRAYQRTGRRQARHWYRASIPRL